MAFYFCKKISKIKSLLLFVSYVYIDDIKGFFSQRFGKCDDC